MAATAIAYWPGITDEQIDSQPPFSDDGYAWAEWVAELEAAPEAVRALVDLGAGALLSVTTPDRDDEDVDWVHPRELRDAAATLREAIAGHWPGSQQIIDVYARHSTGELAAAEAFRATLDELANLARYAEQQRATRMTLAVSW